jgi:hypothetical protein
MLRYLVGEIGDAEILRFNVACCRRIWPLLTDPRSRAVVEVTEQWLAGDARAEDAGRVFDVWYRAYENGSVSDLAGGRTHEAVQNVCGAGWGDAAAVAAACFESVGYLASESLRKANAPQPQITAAWRAAADAEKAEQCRLLRDLFGYVPATR